MNFNKQLIEYCKKGNLEKVKNLIENQINPVNIHTDNDEAFIWANYYGHLEVIKYLVEQVKPGADIHANNNYSVRMASYNGNLELLKYLVDKGANIHANNDYAVINASEHGHLEVVKYLLCNGADIHTDNDEAVICATKYGHLEVVKYLVENGANVNTQDDWAVKLASRNGFLDVLKYLVDKCGADIHADNDYAVRNASHFEIVKYLVEKGADINAIYEMDKNNIFGFKILNFYRRQRDRKKIMSIWRQIVPLYYHPEAKGGYFLKKNAIKELEDMIN